VLVLDEESKKLIDNVVKEDDILNHNIASVFPNHDAPLVLL
jgi:syntaxin-binding protein 1